MIPHNALLDYKIQQALNKIQINKLPHSKLKVIAEALENYIEYLSNIKKTDLEKYHFITAIFLFEKRIKPLVNNRLPRKTTTLKLYYPEANTMYQAFLHYQHQLYSSNQHFAIIENIKHNLYKQLV